MNESSATTTTTTTKRQETDEEIKARHEADKAEQERKRAEALQAWIDYFSRGYRIV